MNIFKTIVTTIILYLQLAEQLSAFTNALSSTPRLRRKILNNSQKSTVASGVYFVKSNYWGTYLRMRDDGDVDMSTTASDWERIHIQQHSNNKYSLRSLSHGNMYVRVDGPGAYQWVNTQTFVGFYEEFYIDSVDNTQVAFRSAAHNNYLRTNGADMDTQTFIGSWEKFVLIPVVEVSIVSDLDGFCLESAASSNTTNGVDLILGTCDSTSSQSWTLSTDGSIRSSLDSSKCIEVQGSVYSSGTPIEVQDCDTGNPAQKWNYLADGTIQSVGDSDYCFDGNGQNEGVYLWTCDGTADQYWTLGGGQIPSSGAPSSAPSATPTSGPPNTGVTIVSNRIGDCLDIPNDDTTNGVDLVLGTCDSTSSQSWLFHTDGSIRSSLDSSKCIEVEGSVYDNGTPIEVQDCDSGNPAQQWTYLADGTIQSVGDSDYCFDENGLGSVVYLWTCDGSSDQYWTLVGQAPSSGAPSSAPSATPTSGPPNTGVTIVSNRIGDCLDIPNDDTTNGVDLVLGTCDSTSSQSWLFHTDGSIRSSLDSSKCIEVEGSVYDNGTPIEVQDCDTGNPAQQWTYLADGTIQSVGDSDYCFDENGLGSVVYLWRCDGSSDQYWTLVGQAPSSSTPSIAPSTMPTLCQDDFDGNYYFFDSGARHCYGLFLSATNGNSMYQDAHGAVSSQCNHQSFSSDYLIGSSSTVSVGVNQFTNGSSCGSINREATVEIVVSSSVTVAQLSVSEPRTCFYEATLTVPPSTNCQSSSPAEVTIISNRNGLCLDIPNDDTTNGVDLVLGTCDSTSSQSWTFDTDGSIHSSLNNNKCIEVQGSVYSSGTPIEVQDCDSGNPAQQWTYLADGTIQSVGDSNYCFDENGNGSVVYLWTCDGTNDQYWTLG